MRFYGTYFRCENVLRAKRETGRSLPNLPKFVNVEISMIGGEIVGGFWLLIYGWWKLINGRCIKVTDFFTKYYLNLVAFFD